MTSAPPREQAGFTLIEIMVALAVLAIASAVLVRAAQAHIDLIGSLQSRAIAQWVAENRLIELEIAGRAPVAGEDVVEMLGRRWTVRVTPKPNADPDIVGVDVAVSERAGAAPLLTLSGFVDRGAP